MPRLAEQQHQPWQCIRQCSVIRDLNRKFVSNPYTIEYDEDQKAGTFTYTHFCMSDQGLFGLVLRYDSLHKTIEIKSPVKDIVFKKKGIIG